MFALLRGKKERNEAAARLYDAVVAQSRLPAFYESYGVPDSVDGRFDLICMHGYLAMDRLFDEGRKGERLAQALFDRMFRDMDRNLREMGVGDLAVPKHMKRMMKGFNGRANSYQAAMRSEDPAELLAALQRNLYGTIETPDAGKVGIMAVYMHETVTWLKTQPWEQLAEGHIEFKAIENEESEDGRDSVTGMVA